MDYEKAYKKLKADIKKAYLFAQTDSTKAVLEHILPELRKSEDERARKRLIAMCQHYIECYAFDQFNLDGYKEALAWLEKQGTSYTKRDVDDAFVEGMAFAKNELEKQGEQKPYGQRKECLDCQFNYAGECKGSCAIKRGEQKSALDIEIPFGARDSELQEATYLIPEGFHAEIEGDKVVIKKGKQKPAWTESDDEELEIAINALKGAGEYSSADWLLTLKQRIL